MKNTINVARSSMPDFEEYCNEIKGLWDSRFLTNMGEKHLQLETDLKAYLGTPNITLFTNGHLALENIITALDLHGEIITSPFTFASTTHAIVRCGCTPVFCDINYDDYTIDVSRIESLITEKTSAIIPIHVYGNLCDTDGIKKIADKYDLKIIYDAAHTFGVRKNDISSANFGDASMFSFHATKVFHTIEGGAVTYSNPTLKDKLNDLKNFGIHGPENVPAIGGNAKMNEFAAAMGICNLRHIDVEIEKRSRVYSCYTELLSGISGIKLCSPQPDVKPNYAYFPVVFDEYKYSRDKVFDILAENNIIARKYFYPLTNSFECYTGRPGFNDDETPIAKFTAEHVLCLPMYADLSLEDVERICTLIIR
ncbi:MAG: DegT/DnrJ/EryC1/StrS family aminotransferase [Eubacteriales bacterium]|nr:DegT/DnrJ/EryC1/StrS family aminotransferase [Eubacteriales bacterium]